MAKCVRPGCGHELADGWVWCPFCGKKQLHQPQKKAPKRANGSGSIFRGKTGYTAQYRVFDGKVQLACKTKTGIKSWAEAELWLAQQSTVPVAGLIQKTMRVSEAWEQLQTTRGYTALSKDKQSHYRTAYKRLSAIQERTIGQIPFTVLQDLTDEAPGDFYAKRDVKALLGKLWEVAEKNEALSMDQDKTALIELPPQPGSTREALTAAEVRALWTAYRAGSVAAGYGLVMCYTGMRPGELQALELDRVDLAQQKLIGGIKSAAGRNREIPLAAAIVPVFADLMPAARHGLIASDEMTFYSEWHATLAAYNIRPHLTPYSCRHAFATALHDAAVDPLTIKRLMGHATDDVTATYIHTDFADKLAAVEAATAVFAPEAAG